MIAEQYHNLPLEMTSLDTWINFKSQRVGEKNTKVPCSDRGVTQSFYATRPYETAKQACHCAGIAGLAFTFPKEGNGIIGIDFDHVVKDDVIMPEVVAILESLGSYTEYSFSGDGLHAYVKSPGIELPGKCRIPDAFGEGTGLEIFKAGCYLTVTGKRVDAYGTVVKSGATIDKHLTRIYKQYKKIDDKKQVTAFKNTAATPLFGDLKAFIEKLEQHVEIKGTRDRGNGTTMIKLAKCPWGEDAGAGIENDTVKRHVDGPDDAVIFFTPGQQPGFHCFHTTCADRRWSDFCKLYPEMPTGNFIDEYNAGFCIVEHGSQVLVARADEKENVFTTAKKPSAFFEAQRFDKVSIGGDSIYKAAVWFESRDAKRYRGGFVFEPGKKETPGCLNLWPGFAVEPIDQGSCDLFYDHWLNVFCGGDKEVYDWCRMWFADILQNPGLTPPGTAIIAKGEQGVGKSMVAEIIGRVLGIKNYCEVKRAEDLFQKHNADVAMSLLVNGSEITFSGDKRMHNLIKGAVTNKQTRLEGKYKDAVQVPSVTRYFITTNADTAIPAERTERRFLVLDVPNTYRDDPKYFDPIWSQLSLEKLCYDLMNLKVDRDRLRRPPKTDALRHEKEHALDPIARWFDVLMDRGALPDAGVDLSPEKPWPEVINSAVLYESFKEYYMSHGYHKSSIPSPGIFVRQFKRMQLGFEKASHHNSDKNLTVPPLEELRSRFRAYVQGG